MRWAFAMQISLRGSSRNFRLMRVGKNDVHFTASFVFEVADPEIEEALAGKRTKTKIQVKRHVPYEGYRVGEWLGGDVRPIVVGMGPRACSRHGPLRNRRGAHRARAR